MIKSDENLINTLCAKTEKPDNCKGCLEAEPKSNSADSQGLALIAVKCAEKDTTYLHEDSLKLIPNSTTNLLTSVLKGCAAYSSKAQQMFLPVAHYVQERNYSAALDVMTEDIIPLVNYCLELINHAPDMVVPPLVLGGVVVTNQSCTNAAGILSNL
ncbi:uncharacterized protein LOC133302450 [Gastrolobium bilobum]|uniref:uncharacterized protein LOC133302450 n=1 Tax=Gastrolobium bilobum TaxID=150636 RepID=UPI002AB161FD|nr:uncharacterized protein LOC133302450 [Gastrolobium bilobum]